MKLDRLRLSRLIAIVGVFLLAVIALPRLLSPDTVHVSPPWRGERQGDIVTYSNVTIGDVLEGIGQRTGFKAVAFPELANRRFSGRIDLAGGGEAAARDLAVQSGLELRRGGPHWVLVAGNTRAEH